MAMLDTADLKGSADKVIARKRLVSFALPALVIAYLTYVFFAFGVPELLQKASGENARAPVAVSTSSVSVQVGSPPQEVAGISMVS